MRKQRMVAKGVAQGSLPPGRNYGKEMVRGSPGGKNLALPAPTNQYGRTIEQRRQVNLCFKCEEKYFLGHQC